MPRSQADFIDRSLETMFARGFAEPSDRYANPEVQERVAKLPRLNLSEPVAEQRPLREVQHGEMASTESLTSHVIETASGTVWLSGNVVMCGCPDCEAPVSIRLWLMVADCWSCGTSIELDYEQQQAAEELARLVRPSSERTAPVPQAASASPDTPAPATERDAVDAIGPIDTEPESRRLVDILRKSMNTLPAWLISTLVHLVLLLLLAFILLPQDFEAPSITLSTAVGPQDEFGGIKLEQNFEEDPLEYDSPLPPNYEKVQRELRKVGVAADQDALELTVDPNPDVALPELSEVVERVTVRTGPSYTMATRDPRLRNEIVRQEGGSTLSEAAVSRGLRWLASVQNRDGSWSLAKYWNHDDPDNRGDAAATSLALLPFLGAGQTHEYGIYKKNVAAGLKWLIDHQEPNGDLRQGILSDAGMYAHGQASIVLVEALAMTGDERFREPAQKAIDFIEAGQHKHGGWRYQPGRSGDTSVLGWQLMALQSARGSRTGLQVDDATLVLADQYLDLAGRVYRRRQYETAPGGTLYRYLPTDNTPTASMTAEAILCRMYLGWKRDDGRMAYAVNWLLNNALPDPDDMNLYYYYYATQVMHHYGGRQWETWNRHLRDLLVVEQTRGGKYPGSWNPREFKYGDSGGRIYVTALAVCTLEVYYRHLPLFKQLDLE